MTEWLRNDGGLNTLKIEEILSLTPKPKALILCKSSLKKLLVCCLLNNPPFYSFLVIWENRNAAIYTIFFHSIKCFSYYLPNQPETSDLVNNKQIFVLLKASLRKLLKSFDASHCQYLLASSSFASSWASVGGVVGVCCSISLCNRK